MSSDQPAPLNPASSSDLSARSGPAMVRDTLALISLLFILLIAAFLRLYQLPALPPGLNFDEAGSGAAAVEILSGSARLWWQLGGGQEPFWPYLAAFSTAVFGNTPLALRLPAALIGILSVAAVYPLVQTLRLGGPGQNRRASRLIALVTVLGLALSGWHLHFSRLGFRAILLPLFSTLAFYFLWRSLKQLYHPSTQRRPPEHLTAKSPSATYPPSHIPHPLSHLPYPPLILASLFTALAIYSYLSARLLPGIPLLFFALTWLVIKIRPLLKRRSSRLAQTVETPPRPVLNRQTHFLFLLISFLFLIFLFLLPLILYFIFNPADAVARSTTVSIFNPAWNNGDLIGTAWRTLITTLGTFLGLKGDPNPLVNLPGQPALSPLLVPFFIGGWLITLYRCLFPTPRLLASPHLFLLCWWLVMLLPAILAPEGAPHHLRLIGTIVPAYAFVAVGLVTIGNFLSNRLVHNLRIAYLLPAAFYLLIAFQTYSNYFHRWPVSVDFTLPFDLYAVRLATDITNAPAEMEYVLPMDIRAGAEARHYTLDYLLAFRQPSPYVYIPVDERSAAALLTQAAAGNYELQVVRWTDDKHREADAKEIVTYLLETTAQLTDRASFPVYDLETYALPHSHTVFALPAISQPVEANFDNLLQLKAAFVPSTGAGGNWLPVAVTLAPFAPMTEDYKASLRLISPTGERIAQKDRVLLHNYHQGTSLWPPEESVNEYYLLPVPPETPPGDYTVVLVIYHPNTQAPLIAAGLAEVPLGRVQIE